MSIGEKILDLRKKKNLSQEELAHKLDVSRQTISKWETDQSNPDFDKIIPLCEVFEITTDELLRGEDIKLNKGDKKTNESVVNQLGNRKKRKALFVSGAVFLYFLGVIEIILGDSLGLNDGVYVSLFLLICAVATVLLIYCFMSDDKKYEKIDEEGKHKYKNKTLIKIDKILALVTTIIYFLVSFLTMAWAITWIIFIVYALVMEIIKLIYELKVNGNEE